MDAIMRLPKLGVNMTEATIVAWKVNEGEAVAEGQPLFEAETDKAIQEFESTVTGVLDKILAPAGTTIACQEPVASFRDARQGEAAQPVVVSSMPVPARSQGRLRISPLARRTARSLGVDPRTVHPGKPGARIVRKDVLAQQEQASVGAAADGESIPLVGTRRTIALRMSQSARETASAVLTIRAKAASLLKWREELKAANAPANLSVLAAVLVGKALERFPILNSTITDRAIQLHREINVGIAVDTDRGLLAPVLKRVNIRPLEELLQEFQRLVAAAKKGNVTAADLADGTFTITNLGRFGIESFAPIINPPECAILALGAITREVVPTESGTGIEVCPIMRLTLVFDHRIVDGAPAARFLQYVKELVEAAGEHRSGA